MKKYFSLIVILSFMGTLLHAQTGIDQSLDVLNSKGYYQIVKEQEAFFKANPDIETDGEFAQFNRWRWFWSTRVQAIGDNIGTFNHLTEASYLSLNSLQKICSNSGPSSNWKSLGPDSLPTQKIGLIKNLWIQPNNFNYMLASGKLSGLFQTFDGGKNWKNITDNTRLPYLNVNQIIEIPNGKHDTIFISTGNGRNDKQGSSPGIGLLKTVDGGKTWQETFLSAGPEKRISVSNLLLHPVNHKMLYATVSKPSGSTELYVTNNGGTTFIPLLFPDSLLGINEIYFLPKDPNTLIVTGRKLWIYNSFLKQWKNSTPKLLGLSVASDTTLFKISITFFNTDIFCFFQTHKEAFGRIRYSSDSGTIWNSYAEKVIFPDVESMGDINTNGAPVHFQISPANKHIMYFGHQQRVVFKGTNDPNSNANQEKYLTNITGYHNNSNGVYIHADIRGLQLFNRGTPPLSTQDTLFANTDGGIGLTYDGGANWKNITGKGLNVSNIIKLSTSEQKSDLVVGGGWDNGSYRYLNSKWRINTSQVGDAGSTVIDKINPKYVYMMGGDGRFYLNISNDTAKTYSNMDKPPSDTASNPSPFVMRNNTIYVGMRELYKGKRANSDPVWKAISKFSTDFGAVNVPLSAVQISATDTNVMYAAKINPYGDGGTPAKFFKTTNGGVSWTNLTVNIYVGFLEILKWYSITDIALNPLDHNQVWVSVPTYDLGQKVYYSSDGGITWENVSAGLPNFPVNCLEVYNCGGYPILFAGTDVGVFYKRPNENWQCFNTNLPVSIINDLEITQSAHKLRASSHGRGFWETDLTLLSPISPDLFMRDTIGESGVEPDRSPLTWVSNDIWVRKVNDNGTTHQNPEYNLPNADSSNSDWVYVKILNRGCSYSIGNEKLKVYWAKASTALSWPKPWDGSVSSPVKLGGPIKTVTIPIVAPGDSTIVKVPWFPPHPTNYGELFKEDSAHFCLLARIETTSVKPYGMTYPEGTNLYNNIRNNNNIVSKNIMVVDSFAGKRIGGGVLVGNGEDRSAIIRFDFNSPITQNPIPFNSVFNVTVNMGLPLTQNWVLGGKVGQGVELSGAATLRIIEPTAWIGNLSLNPNDLFNITINFSPNLVIPSNSSFSEPYIYDFKQSNNLGNVNGERFIIPVKTNQTLVPIIFGKKNASSEQESDSLNYLNSTYHSELTAYPNPAHNEVEVSNSFINHTTKLILYDLQGKEIYSEKFENKKKVNLSKFNTGVYVLRIWDLLNNKQNIFKLIIE